jgi:hypothetical protein
MRSGRSLIQIISDAEPANSADSVQTLLKGYKAAIRGTTGGSSVLRAPRIVLRSAWSVEHSAYSDHTEHKQNIPHPSPHIRAFADRFNNKISTGQYLSGRFLIVPSPRPVSAVIVPVGGDGVAMMPVVMMTVMIIRGLRRPAQGREY